MACHHDNFDLWNSKHHPWNAVKMGPQRDIVAAWQKAAKAGGLAVRRLRHMGASFTWWQVSHGADRRDNWRAFPTTERMRSIRICITGRLSPATRRGTAPTALGEAVAGSRDGL